MHHGGATDEFAGLGRVEQLVVRGDGLTTTSLAILTGEEISVTVDDHWLVTVPDNTSEQLPGGTMNFDHDGPDLDGYLATGVDYLDASPGDLLLVRTVLLVGSSGSVHGTAEVVAMHHQLPLPVREALASTTHPLGRLLRDNGVQVTRELRRWGNLPAGPRAAMLGPSITPSSRVLGRTYVMVLSSTGKPLVALTERFAPHVFAG